MPEVYRKLLARKEKAIDEYKSRHCEHMALDMFHHLKELEGSPAKTQHIFRMICAVERTAAGLLDEAAEEQAIKDIEAAGLFCQAS